MSFRRKGDPPTARQIECLKKIAEHIQSRGFPPTRRELAVALGKNKVLATNAIAGLLSSLASQGSIQLTPRLSRGIVITPLGQSYLQGETRE